MNNKDYRAWYEDELNEKIKQLEEENEKLKSDLAFKNTMLDNVSAEYESLQDVNKSLREENKRLSDFLECES